MPRTAAGVVSSRAVAKMIAVLRVGLGGGLLARPDLLPRLLGVDRVTARRLRWAGQMLGGRDLGLGVGVLVAGAPTSRPWLLAQAFVDAVDTAALVTAARRRTVAPLPAVALGATRLATAAAEVRLALTATGQPTVAPASTSAAERAVTRCSAARRRRR